MSDWSVLSSLRSFFTGSNGNIASQGGFDANAESQSKASALASAFVGVNGADPNSGHLLPRQELAPGPLVFSGPAFGETGSSQLSPPVDVQTTSATLAGGGSNITRPATLSGSLGSTIVGAAGGLQFDLVWDSSVSSAPAGFESAAIAAATYYTRMFSNPETITINVGWGEVGGTAIGSGSLSESSRAGTYEPYSAVRSALLKDASSSSYQAQADSTLPATDPLGARFYYVTTAEAKGLGLMSGTGVDGAMGLSSAVSYDFNAPTTPMQSNQYDAIGAFEHEISEVMGRIGAVGSVYGSRMYTPLDLFRYTSPGVRDTTIGPTSPYFSIDSGATNLGTYNNPATGGDPSDWVRTLYGDSYGGGYPGRTMTVSPTDLIEDSVLGYRFTAAGLAASTTPGLA
jgi:hypothetical protein